MVAGVNQPLHLKSLDFKLPKPRLFYIGRIQLKHEKFFIQIINSQIEVKFHLEMGQ